MQNKSPAGKLISAQNAGYQNREESSSPADAAPAPLPDGEKADLLKIASRGDI
jgi:hypothetical protein